MLCFYAFIVNDIVFSKFRDEFPKYESLNKRIINVTFFFIFYKFHCQNFL